MNGLIGIVSSVMIIVACGIIDHVVQRHPVTYPDDIVASTLVSIFCAVLIWRILEMVAAMRRARTQSRSIPKAAK